MVGLAATFMGCGGGGGGSATPTPVVSTYTVTYQANGSTSGTVPVDSQSYNQGATVAVLGNTGSLALTGYTFSGWNTMANGSGTAYAAPGTCTMGTANVTFYAQWTASTPSVIGYAYVANQYTNGTGGISQYTIGANGALTAMTPAAVDCGNIPIFVTLHPSGKYLYVSNEEDSPAGSISQFTVGADGTLTAMSPAKVVTGGVYPAAMKITPNGNFLYVENGQSTSISQFGIGATGALTPLSPALATYDGYGAGVAIDPTGKYLYVSCADRNLVDQFSIGANGQLTPLSPASVSVSGGNNLNAITVDPSGKYLYVVAYDTGLVYQYTIGAGGGLAPMGSPTASLGANAYPLGITCDPGGTHCYVANSALPSAAVSQFTISNTGALTPMTPASVANGSGANGACGVTVDATGKYLYSANGNPGQILTQYTIGADGSLTLMTPSTVTTGAGPQSVAVWMK